MSDPTPLQMIYDKLNNIEGKVDAIVKCNTQIKVRQETHTNEIANICANIRKQCSDFDEHRKDKELHFNPYHSEGLLEKISRKKGELGVAATGGGLLGLLFMLIEKLISG